MAHSKSAQKRIRQNEQHRARNRWRKRAVRQAMRDYRETILHGSVDQAKQDLSHLYKLLDRTAAKGAMNTNAAARQKSRLAQRLDEKQTHGHAHPA